MTGMPWLPHLVRIAAGFLVAALVTGAGILLLSEASYDYQANVLMRGPCSFIRKDLVPPFAVLAATMGTKLSLVFLGPMIVVSEIKAIRKFRTWASVAIIPTAFLLFLAVSDDRLVSKGNCIVSSHFLFMALSPLSIYAIYWLIAGRTAGLRAPA